MEELKLYLIVFECEFHSMEAMWWDLEYHINEFKESDCSECGRELLGSSQTELGVCAGCERSK